MQTRRDWLRQAALLLCGPYISVGKPGRIAEGGACERAIAFLAAHQAADGGWRSAHYGAFRGGDTLTPLVLWALPAESPAFAGGLAWLKNLTAAQAAQAEPWLGLAYPLFTAAYAAQVFARIGDHRRAGFWADLVEALRTSSALGWPADSPACGAWGDSASPPALAHPRASVPDMLAPNLSATALALSALAAVGRCRPGDGALRFVAACQNVGESTCDEFDDGGFFFALGDSVRNKAGVAGHDASGRERYHSYGSTSCDGLLALHACGVSAGDLRCRAAVSWLERNAHGLDEAGSWSPRRAAARESLRFYYAQALSSVLVRVDSVELTAKRAALTAGLVAAQNDDGSWRNRNPDNFEDEPLVATAFALHALRAT